MPFVQKNQILTNLDLMVDIETTATTPNAGIIAICAVPFDTDKGTIDQGFYIEIDHDSLHSFDVHHDTLQWWSQQETQMPKGEHSIEHALKEFINFAHKKPYRSIWANSPSFDIIILKNALKKCNLITRWPFKYWQEFDVRTLKNILNLPSPQNTHNAHQDCLNQIQLVTSGITRIQSLRAQS